MSNQRRMSQMMRRRRTWQRRMIACIAAVAVIMLGAVEIILARHNGSVNAAQAEQSVGPVVEAEQTAEAAQKDTLIVYFDFSENIGDTSGWDLDDITSASMAGEHVIERGNLLVMEQMLQERLDADVYSIQITEPYAQTFDSMADQARNDIADGKQFDFVDPIPDLSGYSTIYLGTPVWWYGLPQPTTNFLERVDLNGKNLVYFGIHRGSGDSGNPQTIQKMFQNVNLVDTFVVEAHTDNNKTRADFAAFLDELAL